MDVTIAERMIRDVFPADVLIGDKVHTKARVFITSERIQVYVKDDGRARLLIEAKADNDHMTASRATLSSDARLHVETESGPISIARGHGCACGELANLFEPISWSKRRV